MSTKPYGSIIVLAISRRRSAARWVSQTVAAASTNGGKLIVEGLEFSAQEWLSSIKLIEENEAPSRYSPICSNATRLGRWPVSVRISYRVFWSELVRPVLNK